MSFRNGAQLMRASFGLVRRDPRLLWFPVISTVCLAVTAGFWLFQGAFLYATHGSALLYVPVAVLALYSLAFVGVFFNVALAGAAAKALDGEEPSVGDGVGIAWSRLSGIAGWAGFSIFVVVLLSFVESVKGLRWVGKAAEIAWSFATIFVVPLIAVEGLDSAGARARSFEIAKENWRLESGGLGALRAVLVVPGLLLYFTLKFLVHGHAHTPAGQALLGLVVLCGLALNVTVGVVRQVFAVSLLRSAATGADV